MPALCPVSPIPCPGRLAKDGPNDCRGRNYVSRFPLSSLYRAALPPHCAGSQVACTAASRARLCRDMRAPPALFPSETPLKCPLCWKKGCGRED